MAENRLPRALSKLLSHADLQAAACRKHEDTLALYRVRADELERVTADARAAEAELRAAHAAWSDARSERRRIDHESWDFIALMRCCLAPCLGERWSAHWAVVGFTRPTLRVPEQFAARRHVLMFLTLAFDLHPEWEAAEAGFTAKRSAVMRDAVRDADALLQKAATRLCIARKARNTAVTTLNGTLRRLLKELHVVLKPEDPLWLAFDLKQPIRARRKRRRQTNVAIAETSPVVAEPCSDEPRTGTECGPEAEEDFDGHEMPAAFSRVQPVMEMASASGHRARCMTAEDEALSQRDVETAREGSLWSRLRDGARRIRWNLF